jgi:hypothetical protein
VKQLKIKNSKLKNVDLSLTIHLTSTYGERRDSLAVDDSELMEELRT